MEWPEGVKEIGEDNYQEFVNKYPVTVIDFWGPTCAPCKMIAPVLDDLSKQMNGQVAFGKIDVTKNLKLSGSMSIRSIPTLAFYKNGELVKTRVGFLPRNKLITEIREIL
jgi:thioredoxin 1